MKSNIKNIGRGLAVLLALCLLAACATQPTQGLGTSVDTSAPASAATAPKGDVPPQTGQLEVLRRNYGLMSPVENGFFLSQYPQSDIMQNLMYFDFLTLKERYYCEVPGCTHDHEGCVSYDLGGGYLFAYGDYLYNSYVSYAGFGQENPDENPSAIVRYNLDGTDPQVMITYAPYDLQIETLLCDGTALYFAAPDGFVRLSLDGFEKTVVAPYNSQGTADEEGKLVFILGCVYNNQLLCLREDIGSPEDMGFKGEHSLFSLNVQTGEETILHNFPEDEWRPYYYTPQGLGYYVEWETGNIYCYDIAADETYLVTDRYAEQNDTRDWGSSNADGTQMETHYAACTWEVQPLGEWLIVKVNRMQGDADTLEYIPRTYAYNVKTGESKEVNFENFFNGGRHHMYIWGETPHGLLVIEEYRPRALASTGTDGSPYVLDTVQEVYALIDLDDFVNSRPNFRTIQLVPHSGMS